MQLINIPTDNLYKFCSICGLIVVAISIFAPMLLQVQLMEKRNELDVQNIQIKMRNADAKQDQDLIIKRFKRFMRSVKVESGETEFGSIHELSDQLASQKIDRLEEYQLDQLQKMRIDLRKIQEVFRKNDIERSGVGTRQVLNQYYSEIIKLLRVYSIIGILIGLILTVFGFYNWYTKIQRIADAKES